MDFVNICVVNLPRVSLAEIKSKFRDKVELNLAIIINLIKVMCMPIREKICAKRRSLIGNCHNKVVTMILVIE